MIRYESSRGHKIDGTKPNQTGKNTFGDNKQGKQTEENGQESSQQRTSIVAIDKKNRKHKQNHISKLEATT